MLCSWDVKSIPSYLPSRLGQSLVLCIRLPYNKGILPPALAFFHVYKATQSFKIPEIFKDKPYLEGCRFMVWLGEALLQVASV